MLIAFIVICAGGEEKEIAGDIRKLPFIQKADVVRFSVKSGEVEEVIMAKLLALHMTEKQLKRFVRNKIRNMDAVTSTGTLLVVRPEEKPQPIDENLIIEERDDWGPWR